MKNTCLLLSILVPAMACAAPETIRTTSTPPDADQFVRFEPDWASDEPVLFQHQEQRLRTLVVRGVEVVLDFDDELS